MTLPLLDDRLRGLADVVADALPPDHVDRAIAKAIAQARRRAPAPRGVERWLAWPLALTASIFALSFVARDAAPPVMAPDVAAGMLQRMARSFVPIVPPDEIARARDAYVVPASLERTTLAELGMPVSPGRIGESVDAELLVRADGAVLALRLVH
jgi:hypothetical protein